LKKIKKNTRFHGFIDDFRVFDHALDVSQIKNVYYRLEFDQQGFLV